MENETLSAEAKELSNQLAKEFRKRSWIVGLTIPVLLGPPVVISEILFRFCGLNVSGNDSAFYWWVGLIICYMLIGITAIVALTFYPSARARRAALQLTNTSDVSAVPGLLDSLE